MINENRFLTLLLCVISITGCKDNSSNKFQDSIPIIINDSLYRATIAETQADLSIKDGEIRGDMLKLTVSFLGGCEEHAFSLIAGGGIDKSNPPIAHIILTHDANDDACQERVNKELLFDLSAFKEYLQSSGLLMSGTILMPLKSLPEPLRYEF